MSAVDGAPDLYLYFLYVCLGWLRPGDRLAFVLPNKLLVNSNARAFRKELGGDWPILMDPGDHTAFDFGVRAPPESFVVDESGTIRVKFTGALPKTRNAKVLRRAVRAVVVGKDPGDLSSLEDPATIEAVRAAR